MSTEFIDYVRGIAIETTKKKDPRKVGTDGEVFVADIYRDLLRKAISTKTIYFPDPNSTRVELTKVKAGPLFMEIIPHGPLLKIIDPYFPDIHIKFFVTDKL